MVLSAAAVEREGIELEASLVFLFPQITPLQWGLGVVAVGPVLVARMGQTEVILYLVALPLWAVAAVVLLMTKTVRLADLVAAVLLFNLLTRQRVEEVQRQDRDIVAVRQVLHKMLVQAAAVGLAEPAALAEQTAGRAVLGLIRRLPVRLLQEAAVELVGLILVQGVLHRAVAAQARLARQIQAAVVAVVVIHRQPALDMLAALV